MEASFFFSPSAKDFHYLILFESRVVAVQLLMHVWLLVIPWTAACQAPLSFTISQSLLKFMSTESMMPPNHLVLCCSLLLLPFIFPSLRFFRMSQLFASGGQSTGTSASASILLMNIQGWFPLGWTGLIFLQSKGLSRVFSSTTIQKHQLFGTQPSSKQSSPKLIKQAETQNEDTLGHIMLSGLGVWGRWQRILRLWSFWQLTSHSIFQKNEHWATHKHQPRFLPNFPRTYPPSLFGSPPFKISLLQHPSGCEKNQKLVGREPWEEGQMALSCSHHPDISIPSS